MNSPIQRDPSTGVAFQGRSRRVGGTSNAPTRAQTRNTGEGETSTVTPPNGGAFSGRGRRLNAH